MYKFHPYIAFLFSLRLQQDNIFVKYLPNAPCRNLVQNAHQNELLNPNANETIETPMHATMSANFFPFLSPM